VRVLVSVDMEGISGVTGRNDVNPSAPAYERFRHRMTAEANAAVRGAFAAGADSVVVNDSHDGMRNLLYEELDPRAELISGYNKPLCMVQGAEGAEAAIFVGYHAWAGTDAAVLDHTIAGRCVHNWWLNGERVGESQINAAILGHFGVPVVLVCGDDKLAGQIEQTLPGARRVIVKYALNQLTARSLPSAAVLEAIEKEAQAAVTGAAQVAPVRTSGPQTMRIEFQTTGQAAAASRWPTVVRVDDRTAETTGRDIVEVWRMADVMVALAGASEH
jgi:D-amino peptidase